MLKNDKKVKFLLKSIILDMSERKKEKNKICKN